MRKLLLFSMLFIAVLQSKAQYFIPVFDNRITKPEWNSGIETLFADTVHNYLYMGYSAVHVNSSLDSSWVYAYRGNQLTKVGNAIHYDRFKFGAALSNGQCIVATGETDADFYEIDGLNMYGCFNSKCGVSNYLECLKAINDTVYVSGSFSSFTTSGGHGIGGIAPSGSFKLGDGITNTPGGGSVDDIEYFNGELYACGNFNSMNNSNSPAIAKWNGSDWLALGGGLTFSGGIAGQPKSMEVFNGNLYVGGGFDFADNISSKSFARWTGTAWQSVPNFSGGVLSDMKVYHNKLYTTVFSSYDGISFKSYKKVACCINSLEVFQDTLFLAGNFDSISYIPARKLAKFVDGTFSTYAPVTTRWWYNSSAEGQQQPNSCYKYYEVTRDTFVMNTPPTSGYNCRKIKAEQYLPNKTHTTLQPLYVFGDTNRIMYYNSYQKRFVVGYKFNVTVGDTLTYYTPQPQNAGDTAFRVVVDSVTTLTVQTENLKRVYTTPLDGWSFGTDGYAQLIGGLASMLPQPINYYSNEGPLSCYQDTSLYFKYFTGGVSCDYAVSVVTEKKETSFTIYPNPATNQLEVSGLEFEVGDEITVTDLLGRVIQRTAIISPTSNLKLQISNSPTGIYFLQIKTKDGTAIGKFVKE